MFINKASAAPRSTWAAIDAYRRELLPDQELGFGNSVHVQAYRISSLIPGSLSLVLADNLPWSQVFWITAAFMGIGVLLSLGVSEPVRETRPVTNLRTAVLEPFLEYVHRRGWQSFILALAFMVLYQDHDLFVIENRRPLARHYWWPLGRPADDSFRHKPCAVAFWGRTNGQYFGLRLVGERGAGALDSRCGDWL